MTNGWGSLPAAAALLTVACGGNDPLGVGPGMADAAAPSPDTGPAAAPDTAPTGLAHFSFFYTSLDAMKRLSGSANGFGGDLRYGTADGLTGADKICQTIASDVGFGTKTWRAFLSVTAGPDGQPVHAIDRIGSGPWYDRAGRLVAQDRAGLIAGDRPAGEAQVVADLPDETGQGTRRLGDTHDVITGSNRQGQLRSATASSTCEDWTSGSTTGQIGVGHSWPAGSGRHWIEAHNARSCIPGVNLAQTGPGNSSSIGSGGGWGGFYCFALTP
jgi:hypothetical protein